jgi:hypothetical protein
MHKSYEELCALAATGQITGDAMKVLDQHVKGCSSCRAFLEDLVPLKAHVTPVVAGSRIYPYTLPEGMRERFLQRAANDGLALSPGPPMERPVSSGISVPQTRTGFFERFYASHSRPWASWFAPRFVVPALACVLCGALGFVAAEHRVRPSLDRFVVAPLQPSSLRADKTSAEMEALEQHNNDARTRLAAVSTELVHAETQKRELQEELSEIAQRAAAGEQFEKRFREVSAQLEDADARATQLQADLDSERGKAANADAVSLVQQKATEEANSEIAKLEAQLDHLRELDSGKSLAGDLISARNLHIVDVYDSENGERKRAFGRVFFVEGKSLVFYAYDLPDPRRTDKKVEFEVWGEQAGVNTVSINLGAMRSDSSNQGRWVLTCDDPKVLNRINAVYITADHNPQHHSQSRETKLMYAFLGSANHP